MFIGIEYVWWQFTVVHREAFILHAASAFCPSQFSEKSGFKLDAEICYHLMMASSTPAPAEDPLRICEIRRTPARMPFL